MTRCVGCGKELDESQIYYREDDLNRDKPYCESCALISSKDPQLEQKRAETAPRMEDSETKDRIDKLQAKMLVIGILNVLSGIGQLLLSFLSPILFLSGLFQIAIGAFLMFY